MIKDTRHNYKNVRQGVIATIQLNLHVKDNYGRFTSGNQMGHHNCFRLITSEFVSGFTKRCLGEILVLMFSSLINKLLVKPVNNQQRKMYMLL